MINNLDEAIKHCEEVAIDNESMCEYNLGCSDSQYQEWRKYAEEHRQLAEWLRELRNYREERVGCEFCKHKHREMHERPCSLCKHNFMDKFEQKEVNADEKR